MHGLASEHLAACQHFDTRQMPFYTRHKVEPLQVLGQYLSPLLFERALLFGPHAPVLHHANLQAAITRGNHVRGLEELLL